MNNAYLIIIRNYGRILLRNAYKTTNTSQGPISARVFTGRACGGRHRSLGEPSTRITLFELPHNIKSCDVCRSNASVGLSKYKFIHKFAFIPLIYIVKLFSIVYYLHKILSNTFLVTNIIMLPLI